MAKKIINLLILLPLGIILIIFCVANRQSVTLAFNPFRPEDQVLSLSAPFFVFLFISSMNIPRNLIEVTWFRYAATANPVSYLLEAVRSLIIIGWDGEALALGFGIAAVLAVVALAASSWALRVRMARS